MKTENKQLLIVGGTKRNVGKTTLIEKIIKKFCNEHDIISLKIKTIYPDDYFFHGKEKNKLTAEEKFRITEEKNKTGNEDTVRTLKEGAKKVFKIKTKSGFIEEAFQEFIKNIEKRTLIICESNSLRKYIKPSLFLFIKEQNSDEIKPSAKEVIKYADKIITTDGIKHYFNINSLHINDLSWHMRNRQFQ
ncbi:MAG: hypothetical protein L3J35_07300 [Bacteroidales bacterium]|nr:hypothetical protein [Bacteroidales bacterium]